MSDKLHIARRLSTSRLDRRLALVLAGVLAVAGCDRGAANPSGQATTAAPTTAPAQIAAKLPDMPGIHNLILVAPGLYSGSGPEGEAGFRSLQELGVRTVISVDGGRPEVELAKAAGMRYVHLPVGYDGIPADKQRRLARAVRDLPGPVYIHCHHGKHRGPTAAAAVATLLGKLSAEESIAFMKKAGTAHMYQGLYACIRSAGPATTDELDAVPADFPEVAEVSGMVEAMVEIDERFEHLQLIQAAGWKAPADHPDLVPAAEADRLAMLMRSIEGEEAGRPDPQHFRDLLAVSAREAAGIVEDLGRGAATAELDARIDRIKASCKECHRRYRDVLEATPTTRPEL